MGEFVDRPRSLFFGGHRVTSRSCSLIGYLHASYSWQWISQFSCKKERKRQDHDQMVQIFGIPVDDDLDQFTLSLNFLSRVVVGHRRAELYLAGGATMMSSMIFP